MAIPEWADAQLSKDLPILRSRGENQDLEYKSEFPQNVRDIGKEIAAFATSNNGTILVGVSDDGDLVGIDSAMEHEGRDEILRRVEGICRGTIKPAITPTARFAFEDEKAILVLLVPKGSQPVYYSNSIPYVRHITESRPAEPHEVVELVKAHLSSTELEKTEDAPFSDLISQVAPLIFDVIIFGEQREDRDINPWLDMWRSQYQQIAIDLRELAIQDISIQRGLDKKLNELADSLNKVANMRLYLGCGEELNKLIEDALSKARSFKQTEIDSNPISEDSFFQVKNAIFSNGRKLQNLNERAEEMIEQGRLEELQSEASEIGYLLSRLCLYNVDQIPNDLKEKLHVIAKELHLIETMRIYLDGGKSLRAVQGKINDLNIQLNETIKQMP
jgi:ATP-dependent DNA helicase RecG